MKQLIKHSENVCSPFIIMICLIFLIPGISKSQSPTDAIMMEDRRICIAALYSSDSWDEYWEGTLLRVNGNIGTMTKNSYSLMLAGGITNKINILASLPYTTTKASAGQIKGAEGFQDLGIWLKAEAFKMHLGPGDFTTHGVIGFTTPLSNYLVDYAPFSLGLGAPEGQGRLILQYLFDMGIYTRVTGAYLLRGTATLERDFYYSETGYYSDKVDVPNATHFTGTLGCWFLNKNLKVEGAYEIFNTIKGHDIRRQDVGFPSNKMEATSLNFGAQYFPGKGFGVLAHYSQVLEGRNVGKSSGFLIGLTYQFGILNSQKS